MVIVSSYHLPLSGCYHHMLAIMVMVLLCGYMRQIQYSFQLLRGYRDNLQLGGVVATIDAIVVMALCTCSRRHWV